jgi:NAD(P)-dependent dehydrogenase (short-subunit alcohol dehydrogenase family)
MSRTAGASMELGEHNVRVNAIAAGAQHVVGGWTGSASSAFSRGGRRPHPARPRNQAELKRSQAIRQFAKATGGCP